MPMTSWPDNWSVVRVTGHYKNPTGTPVKGQVKFNMNTPGRVINEGATLIVPPLQVVAELDAEGRIAVDLPASNDPDIAPLFTWRVTEFFTPGNRLYTYEIEIPYDVTEIDLAHADEVSGGQVIYRYVRRDGDTMTGYLNLHSAPVDPMHATTKQYVDQQVTEVGQDASNLMSQHLAAIDPHGDRAWSEQNTENAIIAHSQAEDPHGDRAYADGIVGSALNDAQDYTDSQIDEHTNATDPHGDRVYADGIVLQAIESLEGYADNAVSDHINAIDPHGDRAYSDGILSDHVSANDPHGDRAYTDTEISSLEGRSESYADNAVTAHVNATDPHGDRAYADGIVGDSLVEANDYTDQALSGHLSAPDPHGDRAYADGVASDAQSAAQSHADGLMSDHLADVDPHGDRAYADSTFVPLTEVGASVASLVDGQVPSSQIPALAITETFVVSSEAEMLGLEAQMGDIAIRTDVSLTFVLGADDPTDVDNWYQILTPASPVTSVNSNVGDVVLGPTDVGADPTGTAASAVSDHIDATDPHGDRAYADSTFINSNQIGASDGVAPLVGGIVPSENLPEFMDGKTVLNGSGSPGTDAGVEGDFYIDTSVWEIYGPKTTEWGTGVSLIGPQGEQGLPGPPGADGQDGADGDPGPPGQDGEQGLPGDPGQDGRTVLSGTDAPSPTDGQEGDFYVDTLLWEIYGPKGADWGVGTPLIGPQGPPGANGSDGQDGEQGPPGADGPEGPQGPAGQDGRTVLSGDVPPTTEGADGDFYVDTVAWEIYGPKTAGSWGAGVSLIGPQGEPGAQGEEGPQGPAGQDGQDGAGAMPGHHNVLDYGAVGDGVTDDTASIQSALDQCLTDGGGEVFFPGQGRVYSIDGPLRIYRNTTLTQAPDSVIRRDAAGTMLLNGDAEQNFGGYSGHGNIIVQGGTWDVNGVNVTTSNMAISIGHAENVTIRDTIIKDVPGYHAIEFNATRHSRAINVQCLGFIDTGSRQFSEAIQIDLALSNTQFGGFGPYDGTPCTDILIQGCTVAESGTPGTTGWGAGFGSHSYDAGQYHTNIRVIGNDIQDAIQYGVNAYYWYNSTISNNTISRSGGGVRLVSPADGESMSSVAITSNVFTDMGSFNNVIWVNGGNLRPIHEVTVVGNVIDGNSGTTTTHGIRMSGVTGGTVSANTVRNVAGTAISQGNSFTTVVTGNRIENAGASGITCDDGTQCVISDNSIINVGNNGVHVLGGEDVSVTNNIVKGAGRTPGTNYGYRISSSLNYFSITGNRYRGSDSGEQVFNAIGITGTCDNGSVWGNDLRGALATGSTLVENSDALTISENISFSPAWFAYTPVLTGTTTNPSVGSGYAVGSYQRYGNSVFFRASIVFGSGATAGAGEYRLTLPTNFFSNPSFAVAVGIGGSNTPYAITAYADAPVDGYLRFVLPTGGYLGSTGIGSNTWQSGNFIHISGTYEAG